MAKSVRSRGSFSVTRASRWNGEQEKPQDRCGGREGLSRPISLSIGSPFAVLAIRKFQIRNCTNVQPGWLSSCNENRSVLFGQGKRLPSFGFPALVLYLSLSVALSLRSGGPLKRSPVNRGHPLNDQSAACNYVSEATCVLRGNVC